MRISVVVATLAVAMAGCSAAVQSPEVSTNPTPTTTTTTTPPPTAAGTQLTVSSSRWPNVADHISDAIAAGESSVCTLDRPGADKRRDAALKGVRTQPYMDRDEYPFAVCLEGGAGSDVRLVPSDENRSMGAWLGNQITFFPNGTAILIKVGS
jgi:hypothetical protein